MEEILRVQTQPSQEHSYTGHLAKKLLIGKAPHKRYSKNTNRLRSQFLQN